MNLPEAKCEVCGVKATLFLNNRPVCSEHAWEAVQKAKK